MVDMSDIKIGDKIVIPWTGSFVCDISSVGENHIQIKNDYCYIPTLMGSSIPFTNIVYNNSYGDENCSFIEHPECKWVYVENQYLNRK